MGLEGYLLSNSKSHADWQPQGIVSFNFWWFQPVSICTDV
jgi:hypothetical protein